MLADHINRFGNDGPDGLAFPNRAGNPMHASSFITHYWKPAKEAVGLEGLRFHDLRHTAVGAKTGPMRSTRDSRKTPAEQGFPLEAATGIEPVYRALQALA
ncbi:MAG: site-specific integrase [Acidimicrobiales bacterium]|nr:site-specific integrase [Acidimicrobiales bacterium]